MKYVFLLFDADDTLLDFAAAERDGLTLDDGLRQRYAVLNKRLWKRLDEGELTRDELLYTRFGIFFKQEGINADGTLAENIYRKYLEEGHETEPSFGAWLQPLQPQPQPPPGLVVCLTLRTKYSSARNTMTPTTKPCMTAPCVRKSVSFRRPFTPGKISRTLLIWQGFHFLSTTMKYNFNFLLRFFDFKGSIR